MAKFQGESPPRGTRLGYLGVRTRRLAKVILLMLPLYWIAVRVLNVRPSAVFEGIVEMFQPPNDHGDSKPLMGVYYPVDPSTYDEITPQNVKPQIRDVADLMTALYKLFIKMGYMEEAHFAWPPHSDPRIDTEELALYGFTKDVVDLMQLLPYRIESNVEAWNFGTDGGEFLNWGDFIDDPRRTLREPERTERRTQHEYAQQLLDPFFELDFGITDERGDDLSWEDENGPYMRPTYLAMSGLGNHGTVMIFNTENHHMWFVEMEGGGGHPYPGAQEEDDYTGAAPSNSNDLSRYRSWPAGRFLKDIINRFETLQWLPGGLYGPGFDEYEIYKSFYKQAGWPDDFSLSRFQELRTQYHNERDALYDAMEPLRVLDQLLHRARYIPEQRQKYEESKAKAADRSLCKDDKEYERAQEWVESRRDRYEDPAAFWRKFQDTWREQLIKKEAELEMVRTRSGRFEGSTDEEVVEFLKHYEDNIEDLRMYIADESEVAQVERLLKEARVKAALVDDETRRKYEEGKQKMGQVALDAGFTP